MIVDEKGIKDSWKEYMEKLMNEENDWDHRILAGVKEGPKKTWRRIVQKDCQARKLNREDAMGHIRWMNHIRDD